MAVGGVSGLERLGDLTGRLHGVLADLHGLDLGTATDPELVAAMPALIQAGRRLGAVEAKVLDAVDRRRVYGPDGFLSAKAMVGHVGQLPGFEAHRRWQTVRMLRDLPKVAEAYEAGTIGTGQVEELARTHANPRVRHLMADAQDLLLEDAQASTFREFQILVRAWRDYADQDGATDRARQAHDRRDVRMTQEFDRGWRLSGQFGTSMGSITADLHEAFTKAETAVDWDKARAEHGDAATPDHLPRTPGQRRADAWWAMCMAAIAHAPDDVNIDPVLNLVMDWNTFTTHTTTGDTTGGDAAEADPAAYRTRRCSTLTGKPIDPHDAIGAALTGHLRRVVFDTRGVVVDMGRKSRLFTGSARDAAILARAVCTWLSCDTPSPDCEIDHALEWGRGGPTNQANAPPLCKPHNLFKQNHHFTITLEDDRQFHIWRPDGTELT